MTYFTQSEDQDTILRSIQAIHNAGRAFDADITYSKGMFYKGDVDRPRLRFDLHPNEDLSARADSGALPLPDSCLDSVVFDPPFITEGTAKSRIKKRFTSYPYIADLKDHYRRSVHELKRVLKPKGIAVFKCQDMTYYHRQFLTHVWLSNQVHDIGMHVKDLFVLSRGNRVMIASHIKVQQHARKNHCYFLVIQNIKPNKDYS